jgi:hypothetical protein
LFAFTYPSSLLNPQQMYSMRFWDSKHLQLLWFIFSIVLKRTKILIATSPWFIYDFATLLCHCPCCSEFLCDTHYVIAFKCSFYYLNHWEWNILEMIIYDENFLWKGFSFCSPVSKKAVFFHVTVLCSEKS